MSGYYCDCGNRKIWKAARCKQCFDQGSDAVTLADLRQVYRTASTFGNAVRKSARQRFVGDRSCRVCGYRLHVDVCHLIAISDFPDTATIAEVNHPSNPVALCKNHHWEMDHGYLKLLP